MNGEEVYVVQATPLDPNETAYSRRILHLSKDGTRLLRVEFFRHGEHPVKTLDAYGYGSSRVEGETRRPERVVMTNHREESSTILRVIESRLDERLDAGMFTPEGIGKIRSEDLTQLLVGLRFAVGRTAQ